MKEIKIRQYKAEKGLYSVAIGNGITREFANKKHCMKFLNDTSRYLTLKLFETNSIYIMLLTQYRRNWFYFDHNKDSDRHELFEADRACKTHLQAIEGTFELLVQRSGYANGNHMVFSHFRGAFDRMKIILGDLQELHRSKSNAVDVHELQSIYLRVLYLEKELFEFDGTFTKEVLDADEVFTRNRMKAV